jgi:hypothetical protein
MNSELNVAKQEISTVMQGVGIKNWEVQESFCWSEPASTQKFAKLDRGVADSRKQISRVANNTSVQHSNSAVTDESQVQPLNLVHLAHV